MRRWGGVAPLQTGMQDQRHFNSRWVLLFIGALMVLLWVPKGGRVIAFSWRASSQVLERKQTIADTRARVAMLQRQVDLAETEEGRDLEAKRQFGVGSPDEVWITVDARPSAPPPSPPQGIGDRVQGWLTTVGDRCLERVRHTIRVARYLIGIDDVDDCLPAVIEVRDESVEPETEAAAPKSTDGADAQQ